jgi:hypothetical protein
VDPPPSGCATRGPRGQPADFAEQAVTLVLLGNRSEDRNTKRTAMAVASASQRGVGTP